MFTRHAIRFTTSAALLIAVSACGSGAADAPTSPADALPSDVRAHLTEVLGVMQSNSIRRLEIDWKPFRDSVFAAAANARTVTEALPAIRTALRLIGDGHSSYRGANGSFAFFGTRSCNAPGATFPQGLPPNIGYIAVGGFSGSPEAATAFATDIQQRIARADREPLVGWIVDLRGNTGGNMWPMIAGLGPLLGPGTLGSFVGPTGIETTWEYRDGAAWLDMRALAGVETPYVLRQPMPKIAVLVDNAVASSGEATFVAFKGRANTRSFGMPTCGLSTANQGFRISDGALLNLTTSVFADRTKARYGDRIPPDETIEGVTPVVDRAVSWLLSP